MARRTRKNGRRMVVPFQDGALIGYQSQAAGGGRQGAGRADGIQEPGAKIQKAAWGLSGWHICVTGSRRQVATVGCASYKSGVSPFGFEQNEPKVSKSFYFR